MSGIDAPPRSRRHAFQIGVLGALEATENGRTCDLGGPKPRTVLAVLTANVGRRVSTDDLIEAVYGGEAAPGARRSIQTYVSSLKSVLGDIITSQRDGYMVDIDRSHLDATRFEDMVAGAAEVVDADPEGTAVRLRQALALWRGHAYSDVDGGAILLPEISRLTELRMTALEARIDADLTVGRHEQLVPELDALTAEHPYREHLRAQHMLALYRAGRQAEALRAYQDTRNLLAEELGIDPTPELQELEQRILEQDDRLRFVPAPSVRWSALLAVDVDAHLLENAVAPERRVPHLVQTDTAIRDAIGRLGGTVFAQRLNATFASFSSLGAALDAAEAVLRESPEVGGGDRRRLVRAGVDAGDIEAGEDGMLAGPVVTRLAGLVGIAHPGQILLSRNVQADAAAGHRHTLRGLGEQPIPQLDRAESVFQLVLDGLPSDFPPLRLGRSGPLPGGIRMMPGYELRTEIARGQSWSVWRAYQPSVGREVAMKVIAPELANRPEFVRRFELDALTVARLEHPHIVPLFDYWRDLTGAYLVSRWVDGGSLAARIATGPLDLAEVSRLVAQIGGALDAAHRSGITHGSVKPSTILVDGGGTFYLHDFGVADVAADVADPGTDPVVRDVAGLLATVDAAAGVAGPATDAVVALHRRDAKYTSIGELLSAWTVASGHPDLGEVRYTPTRNPYRGLRAFSFADAEDFFGRTTVVQTALDALSSGRLVAMVGPSGVGKSSFVQAGLLPALVSGAIPGSADWFIASMTPGTRPFEALASALLRVATRPAPHLDNDIVDGDRGMIRACARLFPDNADVLLLIDQFEELFTVTADPAVRDRFLRSLTALVTDPAANARVIVTLRADFFDQPLMHPEFGELLHSATVPMSAPTRTELVEMIERPAASVGVGFGPALVERIIDDVDEQPGRLPLLEYALTELFERRTSDVITSADYESMAGVLGALGRRAEELFGELDEDGKTAARQLFLRLVTLTDAERVARRRITRVQLDRLDVDPAALERVIAAFAGHRLLTLDRDGVTHSPTIEVAHEALFSEWQRLAGWVEDRREDLAIRRRLVESTEEWERAERAATMLLGAGRLAHMADWAGSTDLSLTGAERDFLEASVRAESAAAEATRRRRHRVLMGFGAAALAGLILAASAATQQRSADRQRQVATARELSLRAVEQLDTDPERSVLLALEAIDRFDSTGSDSSQAVTALRDAVAANRTVARFPGGRFVAVSPDGRLLATGDGASGVTVRERAGGALLATLSRPGAEALGADFSPDGASVAVAYREGDGGPVSVWLADGSQRYDLAGPPLTADALPPWPVRFSPDGAKIALTYPTGVRVWDTATHGLSFVVEGILPGLFDPSSGDLIVGDGEARTLHILDAGDGSAIAEFPVSIEPQELAVSPDGRWVAVSSQIEASVAVYSLQSGAELWVHAIDRPAGLAWLGDGSKLVVGGDAGEPQVLDPQTRSVVAELLGHNGTVWAVAAIPGTQLVATAGYSDGTALVWNVEQGPMPEIERIATGVDHPWRFALSQSADRLFLSVAGAAAEAWIADTDTLEPVLRIEAPLVEVRLEPLVVGDGRYLTTVAEDGPSTLVDIATGDVVYVAPQGRVVRDASADGQLVLTVPDRRVESSDQPATIVRLDAGDEVAIPAPIGNYHRLSVDGSLITSLDVDYYGAVLYETATGEEAAALPGAASVYVMPDGLDVSVVTADGRLLLAPLDSLRKGIPLDEAVTWSVKASDGLVVSHVASGDGSFIVTGARREPFRVWEASTGRLVAEVDPGAVSAEPRIEFSPTNPRHVTALADDGILLTYTLDTDELIDVARSRLTRGLTDAECVAFLHLASGCPAD